MRIVLIQILILIGVLGGFFLMPLSQNTLDEKLILKQNLKNATLIKEASLYCTTIGLKYFTFGEEMERWRRLRLDSVETCIDEYKRRIDENITDMENELINKCQKDSKDFCFKKSNKYFFGIGGEISEWEKYKEFSSSSECVGDTFARCCDGIGTIWREKHPLLQKVKENKEMVAEMATTAILVVASAKSKGIRSSIGKNSKKFTGRTVQSVSTLQKQYTMKFNTPKYKQDKIKLSKISSSYKRNNKYFSKIPENKRRIGIVERYFIKQSQVKRVNNKITYTRNNIFHMNKKNYLRMKNGKAPIGIDGKPIELHHIKQDKNGKLLELLKKEEHNAYSKTLHRFKEKSEVRSTKAEKYKWDKERKAYWKTRSKDIEKYLWFWEK